MRMFMNERDDYCFQRFSKSIFFCHCVSSFVQTKSFFHFDSHRISKRTTKRVCRAPRMELTISLLTLIFELLNQHTCGVIEIQKGNGIMLFKRECLFPFGESFGKEMNEEKKCGKKDFASLHCTVSAYGYLSWFYFS